MKKGLEAPLFIRFNFYRYPAALMQLNSKHY